MSQQTRSELRAAVYKAIAELGEREAQQIVNACFEQLAADHYDRGSSGSRYR